MFFNNKEKDKEIDRLREHIAKQSGIIKNLKYELHELEERMYRDKRKANDFRPLDIAEMNKKLQAMEGERDRLVERVKLLELQLKKHDNPILHDKDKLINELTMEKEDLLSRLESFHNNNELKAHDKILNDKIDELKVENKVLTDELNYYKKNIDGNLKNILEENRVLIDQIADLNLTVEEKNNIIIKLRKEIQ